MFLIYLIASEAMSPDLSRKSRLNDLQILIWPTDALRHPSAHLRRFRDSKVNDLQQLCIKNNCPRIVHDTLSHCLLCSEWLTFGGHPGTLRCAMQIINNEIVRRQLGALLCARSAVRPAIITDRATGTR